MFNSLGQHACSGLDLIHFHRVCTRSYHTAQLTSLKISVRLTDAILAFYFIPWGTDASEGSLQILTGTRGARAGEGDTLIGIFKEKQEKMI